MANSKTLTEYVKLKLQLNELTREVDAKKKDVVEELLATEDKEAVVGESVVSLGRRPKYSYSKKVSLKEEELGAEKEILKIMKKDEEETGKAELVDEGWFPKVS